MAARTGVRIIHHACFLDDDALAALEARGDDVWVCPGLHYLYAVVERPRRALGRHAPSRSTRPATASELDAQVEGLRKLRAAGVRIVAGGDFGHQWTHHGTYAAELQRYVELVGMTPLEAIHTATRNVGAAGRPRRRRDPRRRARRPARRRRRPDRRHHGAAAARTPPRRHQGRQVRVREPRGLPVTDVRAERAADRHRAPHRRRDPRAPARRPPSARRAATASRPRPWSRATRARRSAASTSRSSACGDLLAAHRILHRPGLNEELAAATVWGSQMGAAVEYADVDGVVGCLVRQDARARPLRRRAEARQRHGRRARTAAS